MGSVDELYEWFDELVMIICLICLFLMLLPQEVEQLQLNLFTIGRLSRDEGTSYSKNW